MSNDHRIERISVMDRAGDMVAARTRQSSVARLLRGPVARAWSQVMDRYAGTEETIEIDRLELRITEWSDELPDREIERRLVTALEEQLEEQFRGGTPATEAPRVQRTSAWRAERWADFLVTGRWYDAKGETSPQAFFAAAVGEGATALLPAWRSAFRRGGIRALDRLVRQMPPNCVAEWLSTAWSVTVPPEAFTLAYWRNKKRANAVAEQLYFIWLRTVALDLAEEESMVVWPVRFWQAVLAQWPADRLLPIIPPAIDWPDHWTQAAQKYAGRSPRDIAKDSQLGVDQSESSIKSRDEFPRTREATHDLFVTGAGLVLLHPYLTMFFQELDLLDTTGKDFRDVTAREQALQLCHWIVTGEPACAEQQTTLYKLLCAWPEGAVPKTDHELPDDWLEAGAHLLRAVIRNWDKLGDISPDALRESFLQREGKIGTDAMGDHLRVEQRGVDILLDYLPWGIGIIKLPWMPKLLRVEWT